MQLFEKLNQYGQGIIHIIQIAWNVSRDKDTTESLTLKVKSTII